MVYEVIIGLGRSWLVDLVGYWVAKSWWQVCWVGGPVASCVLVLFLYWEKICLLWTSERKRGYLKKKGG